MSRLYILTFLVAVIIIIYVISKFKDNNKKNDNSQE